ncbi:MAG: hypothetical protein ACJ74J_02530 [Blastocatellia bacterium]
MKCPRCHVEVPTEAIRCPDCKLPKPKSLIAQAGKGQGKKPSLAAKHSKSSHPRTKPERKLPRWASIAAGALSALIVVALGVYLYWYLAHTTSELDPHLARPAMQKLRQMPSKQADLTVEQYLNQELERSRRVGNLVSTQGWTMRPIEGSRSKMLISFTFTERDNTEQRAEWLADLSHETFTPQTELARAAFTQ